MPVTLHRPGPPAEDAHGNEMPGEPADVPSRAYRVAPVKAREISVGQQTTIVTAAGAFPPNMGESTPRDTDEMTALGKRYRVVGVFPVPKATNPEKVDYVRADLEAVT